MTNFKNLKKGYVSKYFTIEEVACKGTNCCGGVYPMSREFLSVADALRKLSGGPLYVTSGFRCYTHNNTIEGSAPESKHTKGIAMDLYSNRMSPEELGELARNLGLYVIVYHNRIHIDGRYLC